MFPTFLLSLLFSRGIQFLFDAEQFVLSSSFSSQLAKALFQSKQDPLDAALFYLAMKKKSLVSGLFR